ncbi:MAG: sugar ABC transporter ATP-binding protein [Spirochaetales bacterium]|nr:sugar ABC transporter ATP-binding protein [Spirochaetales bacterium]
MEPYLVEMRGIHKQFGGIKALDGVDLCVRKGEILGLLGENGAGKSTLMKILTGVHQADTGEVLFEGREVRFQSTHEAYSLGISIIFQEFNLCSNLSVAENIFLGKENRKHRWFLDYRNQYKQAGEIFRQLDVEVNPLSPVRCLGVAQMQLTEIAKALAVNPKLLIMDEPTSSLSEVEIEKLFSIMKDLKSRGIAVIFISHKLEEVLEITDRVTVLRDGKNAGDIDTSKASRERLITLMVGRSLDDLTAPDRVKPEKEEPVMEVEDFSGPPFVEGVSFTLHRGEILGFAGLVGAGRTELAQLIIGYTKKKRGILRLEGRDTDIKGPVDAVKAGIAYLSEDRKNLGLNLAMTVRENLTMCIHDRLRRWLVLLDQKMERRRANNLVEKLHIKIDTLEQLTRNLSGGNQQKVGFGKWIATEPKVLILDEPTRGIDVGSKAEVHRIICRLADEGAAVMVISSELPEILKISDRIVVMHEGRVTGRFTRQEATQENIMSAAISTAEVKKGVCI